MLKIKKILIGIIFILNMSVYAQFSSIEFSPNFKEDYKLYGLDKMGLSSDIKVDALVSPENLLNISNENGEYKVIIEENKVSEGKKSITLLAIHNNEKTLRLNLIIESEDFSERNYITRIKFINLLNSKRMDLHYNNITESVLTVFPIAAKSFYDMNKLKAKDNKKLN